MLRRHERTSYRSPSVSINTWRQVLTEGVLTDLFSVSVPCWPCRQAVSFLWVLCVTCLTRSRRFSTCTNTHVWDSPILTHTYYLLICSIFLDHDWNTSVLFLNTCLWITEYYWNTCFILWYSLFQMNLQTLKANEYESISFLGQLYSITNIAIMFDFWKAQLIKGEA